MSTVLIVDDDRDICSLLEFKIAAMGHRVLVEHDGEAALAAVRSDEVDLLLLDWMMPRMGGIEVCLELRAEERFERLPIMMLTAKTQESDVQRGLAAGADDYILKPFSPREIVARVDSVLARVTR